MRFTAALMLSAIVATPALAEDFKLKPLVDARLRYERVEQAGVPLDADAVTLRVRAGGEAVSKHWDFLAEGEATVAISEQYNSGLNGKTLYPLVPDPENLELNRLQLQYRGMPKTLVTVGRQRINLDDQRFVGAAGWRQNEQTFDAARVEWAGVKDVKLDVTYSWSVRTIWGVDGGNVYGPARLRAIGGDNVFANLGVKTPMGLLTGFGYWVDQDEAAVSGYRNSSRTIGARLAGTQPLSKAVKLNYAASFARQTDLHRNPNRYGANYWLLEGSVAAKGFSAGGGYEVLGADRGAALTSFQTPLATLHKFQGWADKFLVTPPNGLRDLYATAGFARPKPVKGIDNVALAAAWHRFTADRLGQHFGDELDLSAAVKVKRWVVTAKYADYDAKDPLPFATADTRKFWLQLEWAL